MQGFQLEFLQDGRYQYRFTLINNLLPAFPYQPDLPDDSHVDHKRVVLREVFSHCLVQLQQVGSEPRTGNQLHRSIFLPLVLFFVPLLPRIVNGVDGQVIMKFSGLSVFIKPVKIINPVGYVGSLLNLGNQNSLADGMNSSGRNKKDIPGENLLREEQICKPSCLKVSNLFFPVDLLIESRNQPGSGIGIHHVPHFGFSVC